MISLCDFSCRVFFLLMHLNDFKRTLDVCSTRSEPIQRSLSEQLLSLTQMLLQTWLVLLQSSFYGILLRMPQNFPLHQTNSLMICMKLVDQFNFFPSQNCPEYFLYVRRYENIKWMVFFLNQSSFYFWTIFNFMTFDIKRIFTYEFCLQNRLEFC